MKTLSIDDEFYNHLEVLAEKQQISVETAIQLAISHEVQRQETDVFFASRRRTFARSAFHSALASIADREPDEYDRL